MNLKALQLVTIRGVEFFGEIAIIPFIFQSDSPNSDPVDGLCHGDSAGVRWVQPPQLHVVNLKEHCLPLQGHSSCVCQVKQLD